MKVKWIVLSVLGSTFLTAPDGFIEEFKSQRFDSSQKSHLEIIPVKVGVSEDRNVLHLHGKPLLKISKPSIKLDNFSFQPNIDQSTQEILIPLDKRESKHLEKAVSRYGNEHLAIVLDDHVLATVKASEIRGKERAEFKFSFSSFENILHTIRRKKV
jgi:hypothetical protein